MRKAIGVLMIVVVVGGYIWMTRSQYSKEEVVAEQAHKATKVGEQIEEIQKTIKSQYPSNPKEVVEMHNKLMGICYKNTLSDKEIKTYAETVRQLYAIEFNELNSQDSQISALEEEQKAIGTEGMQLVTSEITETYIAKDNKGAENTAEVNVMHVTNLGSTERTYFLIKENNEWKINGWETAK